MIKSWLLKNSVLEHIIYAWSGLNFALSIMPVKFKFVILIRLMHTHLLPIDWQLHYYISDAWYSPLNPPFLPLSCSSSICSCHMVFFFSQKYLNVRPVLFMLILFLKHQSIECPLYTNPSKLIKTLNIFYKAFSNSFEFLQSVISFLVARHFWSMHFIRSYVL